MLVVIGVAHERERFAFRRMKERGAPGRAYVREQRLRGILPRWLLAGGFDLEPFGEFFSVQPWESSKQPLDGFVAILFVL